MMFLVLGLLVFLSTHSLRIFAEGWRGAQIERLGEKRWKALFSLLSLAGLGLIVWGFGLARNEPTILWLPPTWTRHLAATLTLLTFILLVAAYVPGTKIKAAIGHPMMAAVGVWALAHLLANGRLAHVLLFGSFLVWALAGFVAARGRDRAAGTRYPAVGIGRDLQAVAIGVVAWALFARFGHEWLIGVKPFA
jgi:uncharacterized membrane protein